MVIMTLPLHSSPPANSLFQPLLKLSVPRHLTRDCLSLSDQDFLHPGLLRTPGAGNHRPRLPRYPGRTSPKPRPLQLL